MSFCFSPWEVGPWAEHAILLRLRLGGRIMSVFEFFQNEKLVCVPFKLQDGCSQRFILLSSFSKGVGQREGEGAWTANHPIRCQICSEPCQQLSQAAGEPEGILVPGGFHQGPEGGHPDPRPSLWDRLGRFQVRASPDLDICHRGSWAPSCICLE